MRCIAQFIVLGLLVCELTGCAMFHELKPHRIRRINRGPAPSMDPEFMTRNAASAAPTFAANAAAEPAIVRAQH